MLREHEPTIATVELKSIALGVRACDALLKKADVRVLASRPVSPGRYVIVFTGSVEAVRSALAEALEQAGDQLADSVLLPAVEPAVIEALSRPVEAPELDAVGVIETYTIAAAVEAADAAVKRARVQLIELHLARGIGGKSYVTLCGAVSDVETAVGAAAEVASRGGRLVSRVIIPRAHPDLRDVLSGHQRPIEP